MQYGTFERRINKDSIEDFDQCHMSLKHTSEPMLSPEGIIFDKKSIIEYILKQKKYLRAQKKAYEAYLLDCAIDNSEKREHDKMKEIKDFIKVSDGVKIRRTGGSLETPFSCRSMGNSISGETPTAVNKLSRFACYDTPKDGDGGETHFKLTDGKGPLKRKLVVENGLMDGGGGFKAPREKITKPAKHVKCPVTGKKLEYKGLMEIKFKAIDPDAKHEKVHFEGLRMGSANAEINHTKWCCAITGDPLHNMMQLLVMKTPGEEHAWVVSEKAFNEMVKPNLICPLSNKKITMKDVFTIRRSGTGFSKTNEKVLVKTECAIMMMSSS